MTKSKSRQERKEASKQQAAEKAWAKEIGDGPPEREPTGEILQLL